MTKEMKEDLIKNGREALIKNGREDLVEILDINQSGYAGVLSNGNIVSRLQYPEAFPIQENSLFIIPKPKKIKSEITSDYVCIPCGKYFLTEKQLASEGNCHTAHLGICGVCDDKTTVLNIRHYNYLNHFKYKPNGKNE